jgi:hypothetical protein
MTMPTMRRAFSSPASSSSSHLHPYQHQHMGPGTPLLYAEFIREWLEELLSLQFKSLNKRDISRYIHLQPLIMASDTAVDTQPFYFGRLPHASSVLAKLVSMWKPGFSKVPYILPAHITHSSRQLLTLSPSFYICAKVPYVRQLLTLSPSLYLRKGAIRQAVTHSITLITSAQRCHTSSISSWGCSQCGTQSWTSSRACTSMAYWRSAYIDS